MLVEGCLAYSSVSCGLPPHAPGDLHAVLNRVAFIMHFCALWQQALATFSAATRQQGSSVLGSHACAESELTLATAFGRLICSLAHSFYVCIKISAPNARAPIIIHYQNMSSTILPHTPGSSNSPCLPHCLNNKVTEGSPKTGKENFANKRLTDQTSNVTQTKHRALADGSFLSHQLAARSGRVGRRD